MRKTLHFYLGRGGCLTQVLNKIMVSIDHNLEIKYCFANLIYTFFTNDIYDLSRHSCSDHFITRGLIFNYFDVDKFLLFE